jgi:hypothetical protein
MDAKGEEEEDCCRGMFKREEAGALLCGAWFCVPRRSCFMSFSVIGVVANFADLWRWNLDIELEYS